ncbi:MAG: efflux RND transporter periplasmic adaptor subunit, partial [Cyclobacteriaceae bacterium]|nr:efflux RND transporter periplasmic adaptor subunit [Cyclobacteriaceae bacterium]
EANGRILRLDLEEGDVIPSGKRVGLIDSSQLYLTRQQLLMNRKAILASRPDVQTQIEATKKEIESAQIDKKRIENLIKGEVATQKQLDDVNARLAVLEARLSAQRNSLLTSTASLNEQSSAIDAQLAVLQDQLKRCKLVNPVQGTVLSKYARANEITGVGKALYKIANLDTLVLRAYLSGSQLSQVKLGQQLEVLVDADKDTYKTYPGTIDWISDKAEFTPKTIQTKDERANLVYAIKINVKNDGFLKLGMYGEVKF